MTYEVLARKWRPKSFQTMIGQQHVLRALSNSLNQQKPHHAYLFSGTHGVGKTTLARILAKCVNCEVGISSAPCGRCDSCLSIDKGQNIDVIEIDAASRTKVEDTRELLNNVQYRPNTSRFKVYIIDEVHMLSTHSFNALLKTLEEPPSHALFILCTTDPQKLPLTILSRCLQFHLKNLSAEVIASHLQTVLEKESIPFENAALLEIANAAKGSMRDALSLLDQTIAYGDNEVRLQEIQTILGTLPIEKAHNILTALAAHNAAGLLQLCDELSECGTDFKQALDSLLNCFHSIAIMQALGDDSQFNSQDSLQQFSLEFSKPETQLFYQIALMGKKDLLLAPSPKVGFEMTLLRMLEFTPESTVGKPPINIPPAATENNHKDTHKKDSTPPLQDNLPKSNQKNPSFEANNWTQIVSHLNLSGMLKALAENCDLQELTEDHISLTLNSKHTPLLNKSHQKQLEILLNKYYNKDLKLNIYTTKKTVLSPMVKKQQESEMIKSKAQQSIHKDDAVAALLEGFNATMDDTSITAVTFED